MMSVHILTSIAGCDLRMGQPTKAEDTARKVLAGAPYTEERVGLITIATARSRLADALRAQGKYEEAIPVAERAVAEFERSEGADGQRTISALSSLGYIHSLSGDDAKALALQREVYQRAAKRWGPDNQYSLVELLNLGSGEFDAGELKSALPHLQHAEAGLTKVSGAKASVTQAARVALARALSDLGQNDKALAMLDGIDPVAYQATTSDPGQAQILAAIRAHIELRLRRPGAKVRLRDAIAGMQAAGVADDQVAAFRDELSSNR